MTPNTYSTLEPVNTDMLAEVEKSGLFDDPTTRRILGPLHAVFREVLEDHDTVAPVFGGIILERSQMMSSSPDSSTGSSL